MFWPFARISSTFNNYYSRIRPSGVHVCHCDFLNFQAVYSVSTMDTAYITERVMEVMLNLVDTLMEIGVHKSWQNNKPEDLQPGTTDPLIDFNKDKDSKVNEIIVFNIHLLFLYVQYNLKTTMTTEIIATSRQSLSCRSASLSAFV